MAIVDRPQEPGASFPGFPAIALAIKQLLETATGAEDVASRAELLLADAKPAIAACLAELIQRQLVERYRVAKPRGKHPIDPERATMQCGRIAEAVLAEPSFIPKLARWIAVNVCFWLLEGDSAEAVDDSSIESLIRVYAEGSAQVVGEMMSPPSRPIVQLEEILGVSSSSPATTPLLSDIPQGMLPALSARHFHILREALYKDGFARTEGVEWPTAPLDGEEMSSYAQLCPPEIEADPWLPPARRKALAHAMWRQQSELSDRDADALDALCAIYLSQARSPDDAAVADIDQILALRGLKPKVGGGGRRGGYEAEQRDEVRRALVHIQNLWLTIAEVTVHDRGAPVTKTLQSRPFLLTDRVGSSRFDGNIDLESFVFRPGKAFAAFLLSGGRHLLFQKALQYDPYRKKWEKRLARYLSWQWGVRMAQGEQTHSVRSLLEAVGEEANSRYPAKTRARLETALDTLLADGIVAGWHYGADTMPIDHRNWLANWLEAEAVIEAPAPLKAYYANYREASAVLAPEGHGAANFRIRKKRMEAGMTQQDLARRLGIGQGTLSKIECGKVEPSARICRAIEAWLDE